MTTIYVRPVPEDIRPGMRLGRNVRTDSRSAGYPYEVPVQVPVVPVMWKRLVPILDQGDLGSCTGNAIVGALGCEPDWDSLPAGHPPLDEAEAVKLYSRATVIDDAEGYTGQYPPDDTGSDGLSVCKAAQEAGLISGYTHCLDVPTMQQALQRGPVIVGVNWYSSFDQPASSGLVAITPNAYVRGGHEFVVRGDDGSGGFLADNSWGTGWGLAGSFTFSYATMERLLAEQGDCMVPVPALAPAPPPPDVTPGEAFAAVLKTPNAAGRAWVDQRHSGYVTKVAKAAGAWLAAEGL